MKINVIIPVFNESDAICHVLKDIPAGLAEDIVVINNGSTDNTAEVAKECGATVLLENNKGYGSACLKGIEYIRKKSGDDAPDIIVFLDGDYSDYPEEMKLLIAPIADGTHDMVIGSRALGQRENGSMMPQQIFGNWLATTLIRRLYNVGYTDLGPFRAISWKKLLELEMCDRDYGWTVEMQVKAAKKGLRSTEIPVKYRKRIGKSKVTGTIKGTFMAGYKIISTIFKYH